MKIKVVGQEGERTYECEDVTVTYYTEATLAFQDAHKAWRDQLSAAQREVTSLDRRWSELNAQAARRQREMSAWQSELDALSGAGWRLWLPRNIRRMAFLKRSISQAEQEMRSAQSSADGLRAKREHAVRNADAIAADEVTPGIELAMRSARDRKLVRTYLPQDGDVAYIMNDAGKTIDVKRWPMPEPTKMAAQG